MGVYVQDDFGTIAKADDSPLTKADLASHRIITEALGQLTPDIPVLSEESPDTSYETRRGWTTYWLVDPLDGTKEFLKRNDEFTVNVALIERKHSCAWCRISPCTQSDLLRGARPWVV